MLTAILGALLPTLQARLAAGTTTLALLVAALTISSSITQPLLGALAVLNLLGQLGLVRAFSLAPVSVVAPFEYSALLWAAGLGFVVFGDVPSARLWFGAAIIIGAGIYATLRTRPKDDPVPLPGQSV